MDQADRMAEKLKASKKDPKEEIETLIDGFNQRLATDQNLRRSLEGKDRSIAIIVTDGESYGFRLNDCKITTLVGMLDNADIVVTADTKTFQGLLDKKISPLHAYATNKIQINASLMDLLTMRQLLP